MPEKLARIGENLIKCIALVPLLLVTILTLLYQNNVVMNISEQSIVSHNNWTVVLLLGITLLIWFGLFYLIKRVKALWMFILLAVIYLIAGIYAILNIDMTQVNDAWFCYTNAQLVLQGDYSGFQFGEYFYKCPHQLGLLLYNCILLVISDKISFIYCVNLIWVITGVFFLWRSSLLTNNNAMEGKITIFMAFAFLPQFLFIFFAYGLVPGLGCLLIAVFFWGLYFNSDKKRYLVLGLLFVATACFIRMNYVIAGIALVIISLLYGLQKKKVAGFITAVLLMVAMILPKTLIYGGFERVAQVDLSQGIPSTLYIAMGLQEDDVRAAGWYSGFNHETYTATGCDVEASAEIASNAIAERLRFFAQNPGEAFDFFAEKVITTWCEPTFQSAWSGPMIGVSGKTQVPWLRDFYSGGDSLKGFSFIMNGFNVLMFGFATFYVLWNLLYEKKSMGVINLFGILFFLGGFLFHLFWEAKSQYVYPYVVCLLPVAASGVQVVFAWLTGKCKNMNKQTVD